MTKVTVGQLDMLVMWVIHANNILFQQVLPQWQQILGEFFPGEATLSM